jgi:hypothetical protein
LSLSVIALLEVVAAWFLDRFGFRGGQVEFLNDVVGDSIVFSPAFMCLVSWSFEEFGD